MQAADEFSYICHRCQRCCKSLEISVNPYDVARLAEAKNLSTTEFIAQYVDSARQTLRRKEAGDCIFLAAEGCSLHAARPLPCRLYPLARRHSTAGPEIFAKLALDAESAGEYGTSGRVSDYLQQQDAARHIKFADDYFAFFAALLAAFRHKSANPLRDMALEHLSVQRQLLAAPERAAVLVPLLDLDAVVNEFCRAQNLSRPESVDARAELHLQILAEKIPRA